MTASSALAFRVEVIDSNFWRRSAVRSSAWLGFGMERIAIGLFREFYLRTWMLKSVDAPISLNPQAEAKARSHVVLSGVLRGVMPCVMWSNDFECPRKLEARHGYGRSRWHRYLLACPADGNRVGRSIVKLCGSRRRAASEQKR